MVLGVKKREKMGHLFGEKGTMTRAYGYIYTIFGLEASHASLPGKPFDKACPGPMGGPKPEAR